MRASTARLLVFLTAILFSTGGAAIKATSLTNWQVAALRSGVAGVLLAIYAGRGLRFTPAALLVGAAQAGTLITFVTANKLTTAANSVFFQGTAPLYIALLGPWLLGERLSRRDYPILAGIATGIVLLFAGSGAGSATAPNPALGNTIGIISGFCWSLTVMGLRWIAKRDPEGARTAAGSAVVFGNLIAFAFCLPLALPLAGLGARDLVVVGYLGVFQVGLAYLLLTRAMAHVPAVDASLLLLAEPALSPLWAWLVHGEAPGLWPLMGGVLIVGSAAYKTWRDARSRGSRVAGAA